jgi:putative sterol carrier protein
MGNLVKAQKDTVMKHDYKHWQEHGFYDSFEKYIQQSTTEVSYDQGVRDAWIKEMIQEHKAKKKGAPVKVKKAPSEAAALPKTCRELIQAMPMSFQPEAAGDLEAKLQFEVHGEENFVSHLKIAEGTCTYQEGPADKPNLVIKTPADVWLKISRGELSGQKAFMEGRYKVEGDMTLLLKLNRLFSA